MTLPGISSVLGYTILTEIGQVDRFDNCRSLLRYSLLAPMSDDTGEPCEGKPIGRRIGHAGRATLQWAFIEASHTAVRRSPFFREIFNRRTHDGKQDRGRGYITVANRLCRIAFSMLRHQTNYQEIPPARPGGMKHQSSSRPEVGQLYLELARNRQVSEA